MTLEHCIAIAIGRRVRALRLARRFSQAALGARLGCPAQQISRLERAGRGSAPTTELVLAVARALDVPADALLSVLDHFAPALEGERRREGAVWAAAQRRIADDGNVTKARARRIRGVLDRWLARRSVAA